MPSKRAASGGIASPEIAIETRSPAGTTAAHRPIARTASATLEISSGVLPFFMTMSIEAGSPGARAALHALAAKRVTNRGLKFNRIEPTPSIDTL
jgi:hypothetical protein